MTTSKVAATKDSRAPVVSIRELTKRFGSRTAVDGLTLEVPAGVVAGFIGPNGAGKTTTMAMLLGLVAPTAGTGEVLGHPLGNPAAYLGRVGALVEAPAFWPGLTGTENLRVVAELAGHDLTRIPEVLDLVGLAARSGDRFGQYSFGMKQRLGIAAALIGEPELLVLDEPTNGLDPAGITEMRRLIAEIGSGDRTVLVSSHILSELEQVCDWLIVIDRGALLYQGPADGFLGDATPVIALAPEHDKDLDRLESLAKAEGFDVDSGETELLIPVYAGNPTEVAAWLNKAAMDDGIVLVELHLRRPTLESQYLAIVEGAEQ
jgi:ABC-2 type transport system ATP-binding protein